MAIPYQITGNFTGSIISGSFLNEQDTTLFYTSQSTDIWFGFSPNDVIEISSFNVDNDDLIKWNVLGHDKKFQNVTLSYIDNLNNVQTFTYKELIRDFIQYKNDKILINPIDNLNQMGITEGNLKLSYLFCRNLAGSNISPLVIKEISPSRTEIKLIPVNSANIEYSSFCLKKFPVRDISPVLLSLVQNCPYDNLYRVMYDRYSKDIEFLKTMFFLKDDGSVLLFLKNLYEDYIKYTFLSEDQIDQGLEPTRIFRVQGIRTYFTNFILQNYETASDFDSIEEKFSEFVKLRMEEKFLQYKSQTEKSYLGAKNFVYDFFVKYFYQSIIHPLQKSHKEKYFGKLKNVLNFGNNQYFSILDHTFLDERVNTIDPLTLVLKLSANLPVDISSKDHCWISNFSMVPFITTVRLQNPVKYKTIKISTANFGATSQFITRENINKLYSSEDLDQEDNITNEINIRKNISLLNTDYSNFYNFIVFSSAATRIEIFKKKIILWTQLSSSISSLNNTYSSSLSSSTVYPYYNEESEELNDQINNLIGSFDGYESYLFNKGYYQYSIDSSSFISSSYVREQDFSASLYDKNNRDNLISNTPEYIINDSNNQEYLTFLSMIGHHFDNIYVYIGTLPVEKQAKNEISSSIPVKTLKEMLYSFGWNVDDIIGDLDIDEVYLNNSVSPSYNSLSAEQRLQTIWNRLIISLPEIYKTKGTEECVNYLMSCYGLPTSLISIREYGGTDFSDDSTSTYKLDEKIYMLAFTSNNDYIEGPIPSSVKTVEFKFSVASSSFSNYQTKKLFSVVPYPYSSSISHSSWHIGLQKLPGQYMGKIIFQMNSGSTGIQITSSNLPLFNGDIFNVMLRKNNPSSEFQFASSSNSYPTQYDLYVQRNENGRKIFYSTSSAILNVTDNTVFSQYGKFYISDGTFIGTIDKLGIWDIPLDDLDFEEHVNDINSYGYSGSNAYQNMWVKLGVDYPKSMYFNLSGSSSVWVDNQSPYYSIPNYYTTQSNLSSSIDPTLYTASLNIINNKWRSYYPTGSVEIIARNFPSVIHPNWSASFNNCNFISNSVYPFHYREITYQQDIDASKYGPTKYKNKKIRKLAYEIESRLDYNDRSTTELDITVSGETNQLGFFIDPQDSKNKDIIRYFGKNGIMELIGDPSELYNNKYSTLRNKNYEYHSFGNKKTLFNELITVYKFYFDKSIFKSIKNILPARSNIYTGIVVEPTVLERPKYQNKQITSSIQISYQEPGNINNIVDIKETLLWANFNTDWYQFTSASQAEITASLPPSYQDTIDLSRINEPIRIYPDNVNMGYITDELDPIQRTFYGDYEKLTRGWEPEANCRNWIYGSTSRNKSTNLPSINYHHTPIGIDETGINSQTKHQILYYLMKVWEQYSYFTKTGEYIRSNNPAENTYDSSSIYLYKYVLVDEKFMNEQVHFYNNITTSIVPEDPSYNVTSISGNTYYTHKSNTFKFTPDQTFSNVSSSFTVGNPFINPVSFDIVIRPTNQYFELSKGYPRNHYIHKSLQFTKVRQTKYINSVLNGVYVKGKQTVDTTINESGIDDGTFPVQSFNVSNVNVKNANNVLQFGISRAGNVTPGNSKQTAGNGSNGGINNSTNG